MFRRNIGSAIYSDLTSSKLHGVNVKIFDMLELHEVLLILMKYIRENFDIYEENFFMQQYTIPKVKNEK